MSKNKNDDNPRLKIAARLRWLSVNMTEIGGMMMRVQDPPTTQDRAAELIGAARLAAEWARALEDHQVSSNP